MTGLPCSGKTTLSKKLNEKIPNLAILDGDEVREWFSSQNFTKEGISQNNKSVAHVAKLLSDHNIPVCVALVSPYENDRKNTKSIISNNEFLQVYLQCSNEVCEKRDVKGHYKKARAGLIEDFTGISAPYEPPLNPDIHLRTDIERIECCVKKIVDSLNELDYVKKDSHSYMYTYLSPDG